jgi:hypothetical protein
MQVFQGYLRPLHWKRHVPLRLSAENEWAFPKEKLLGLGEHLSFLGLEQDYANLYIIVSSGPLDGKTNFNGGISGLLFKIDLFKDLITVCGSFRRWIAAVWCWCGGSRNCEEAKVDDQPAIRWKAGHRDGAFQLGHHETSARELVIHATGPGTVLRAPAS